MYLNVFIKVYFGFIGDILFLFYLVLVISTSMLYAFNLRCLLFPEYFSKRIKHSRRAIHTYGEREVHTGAKRIHILSSRWSVFLLLVETHRVSGARAHDVGQAGGVRRRAQPRAAVARALRQRRLRAAAPAPAAAQPRAASHLALSAHLSERGRASSSRSQLPKTASKN